MTIPVVTTPFTPPAGFGPPSTDRERYIVGIALVQYPPTFLASGNDSQNIKLFEYIKDALAYVNNQTPQTDYSLNAMPKNWDRLVIVGSVQFAVMFSQLGWTLQDFSYSDNGLSLTVDRVPKMDIVWKNAVERYDKMVMQMKYGEMLRIGGHGISTPRYQSTVGQFLKIALGSTFSWNSP
jgi:hypothetical protein